MLHFIGPCGEGILQTLVSHGYLQVGDGREALEDVIRQGGEVVAKHRPLSCRGIAVKGAKTAC